jgi:hypothetical protein
VKHSTSEDVEMVVLPVNAFIDEGKTGCWQFHLIFHFFLPVWLWVNTNNTNIKRWFVSRICVWERLLVVVGIQTTKRWECMRSRFVEWIYDYELFAPWADCRVIVDGICRCGRVRVEPMCVKDLCGSGYLSFVHMGAIEMLNVGVSVTFRKWHVYTSIVKNMDFFPSNKLLYIPSLFVDVSVKEMFHTSLGLVE